MEVYVEGKGTVIVDYEYVHDLDVTVIRYYDKGYSPDYKAEVLIGLVSVEQVKEYVQAILRILILQGK